MAGLLAFLSMPGPMEMLIILGVGVLLFGSRLPEVGRSLGKSIMEFKKGIQGIEEQIHSVTSASASALRERTADSAAIRRKDRSPGAGLGTGTRPMIAVVTCEPTQKRT